MQLPSLKQRYKFVQYYGIWDIDQLYDMKNDAHEEHNLIFNNEHQQLIAKMRADLPQFLVR